MSLTFIYCLSALLLSDNRIESLIQKADQVLSSLSQRADGEFCPGGSAKSSTPPETPGSPLSSVTFSTPFILYPPFLSCTGSRTPTERRKYRTFKNILLPKKKKKVFRMQHNYILRKMSSLKGKELFYYCSLWVPAPLSHGESETLPGRKAAAFQWFQTHESLFRSLKLQVLWKTKEALTSSSCCCSVYDWWHERGSQPSGHWGAAALFFFAASRRHYVSPFFVIVLIDTLTVKCYKDVLFYAGTRYQHQGATERRWQTQDLRYRTVDTLMVAPLFVWSVMSWCLHDDVDTIPT